jgi:hypothetical protein
LLADSTLQYINPEEDDFDHREYRNEDFMPGMQNFGYDARLFPPKDIRWLVTNKIVDTVKSTETEAPVPLLTPLVRTPDLFDAKRIVQLYHFAYPHFLTRVAT